MPGTATQPPGGTELTTGQVPLPPHSPPLPRPCPRSVFPKTCPLAHHLPLHGDQTPPGDTSWIWQQCPKAVPTWHPPLTSQGSCSLMTLPKISPFVTETLSKLGGGGNFLNFIKNIDREQTASIRLAGEKLKAFPRTCQVQRKDAPLATASEHGTGSPNQCDQRNERYID